MAQTEQQYLYDTQANLTNKQKAGVPLTPQEQQELTDVTNEIAWRSKNLNPESMPAYVGGTDANGNLLDKYQLQPSKDIAYDPNIQNNPWVKMLLQQQQISQGQQYDQAGARNNAATSRAFSDLASRGGLSSGARERVATNFNRSAMTDRNDIARQGEEQQLGIMSTGMEKQAGLDQQNRAYQEDVSKFNIGNLLGEKQNLNAYNLAQYQEQMKAWAADRTAQAQERNSK